MLYIIGLIVFLVLLFSGMPMFYVMYGWSLVWFFASGKAFLIAETPACVFAGLDSFVMLAIPLFTLASEIMNSGGLTLKILKLEQVFVGKVRGGLAYANIIGSTFFGGISGAALADITGLGAIEAKTMIDEGYDRPFTAAITGAAALQAPLIPPSIPAVVIGGIAGVSIGGLFLGGVVPGLMIAVGCAVVVFWRSKQRGYPKRKNPLTKQEIGQALIGGIPAIIAPLIIMGGIVTGVFSPTEAAAVTVLYALIVSILTKEMKPKDLPGFLNNAAVTSAQLYLVMGGIAAFQWVLSYEGFLMDLTNWVIQFSGGSKYLFLLVVNILLLIWGMWMPLVTAQLLLCPILFPIAGSLGIHPVHFGVICIFNLMMGLMTPPVGQGLFTLLPVCKVTFMEAVRELIPFLIADAVMLLLITYIPELTLFLPKLFGLA